MFASAEAQMFGASSVRAGRGQEVRKSLVLHCADGYLGLSVDYILFKKNLTFYFEIIVDSHAVVRNKLDLMHSLSNFSQ